MRATWIRSTAVAAAMVLGLSLGARGSGVDPRYIPADAKWVIHVDVDALAKSKLWSMLAVDYDGVLNGGNLTVSVRQEGTPAGLTSKRVKAVADALGMQLPGDVHGITLVGRSFDEEGVMLLVKANVEHDRLIGMAKLIPGYKSAKFSGVDVMSLGDDDDVSGAFLADDVLVLARETEGVRRAIKSAATDKEKAEVAISPLLAGSVVGGDGAGISVYVAAEGLEELQEDEDLSPILAPVKRVNATIGERGEDLVLKATLLVKDGESARQVRGALEGIRAMVTLAGMDGKDAEARVIANLATRATLSTDDTTVKVDWPVSLKTLAGMVEKADRKGGKKRRPATQEAATQPAAADAGSER